MTTQAVIDDDLLSAWLDDALGDQQRHTVQEALEMRPELQQRLARLMLNERRVRDHFHTMAQANPVPGNVLALLSEKTSTDAARPWFLSWSDWTLPALPRPVLAAGAMAVVLAIGIILGRHTDPASVGLSTAAIEAGHDWFALLESTVSGEPLGLENGATGQVMLTYRDASGDWCRQFEVYDPRQSAATAAVACRQQGHWQIRLAQRFRLIPNSTVHYQAASGEDLAAIDVFINNGIDGDVLVGRAEAELIQARWP